MRIHGGWDSRGVGFPTGLRYFPANNKKTLWLQGGARKTCVFKPYEFMGRLKVLRSEGKKQRWKLKATEKKKNQRNYLGNLLLQKTRVCPQLSNQKDQGTWASAWGEGINGPPPDHLRGSANPRKGKGGRKPGNAPDHFRFY